MLVTEKEPGAHAGNNNNQGDHKQMLEVHSSAPYSGRGGFMSAVSKRYHPAPGMPGDTLKQILATITK
jgi:hypothetical protein